jgi:drug/metabolite transporter (DMT)-like permease
MVISKSSDENALKFGILIAALGGLLFTVDLPLLRLAGAEKWAMVFARGMMLFVSITVVWLLAKRFSGSKAPFIAGGAGVAVIFTNALANITYIGAIVETDAANVVFILALIPILTALLSRIFIREPVHVYTWAASFMAFVGVAFIAWDGLHSGKLLGDALAFVCACCTAAAFTIVRRSGQNIATSLAVGSLLSALVALAVFPIDFTSLISAGTLGAPALFWIAINGLVAIPIASSLLANGPRYLPSVDVSMFFLLETVLTPVWIWMLFDEKPSLHVTSGGLIIIGTLLVHSIWRIRQGLSRAVAT